MLSTIGIFLQRRIWGLKFQLQIRIMLGTLNIHAKCEILGCCKSIFVQCTWMCCLHKVISPYRKSSVTCNCFCDMWVYVVSWLVNVFVQSFCKGKKTFNCWTLLANFSTNFFIPAIHLFEWNLVCCWDCSVWWSLKLLLLDQYSMGEPYLLDFVGATFNVGLYSDIHRPVYFISFNLGW